MKNYILATDTLPGWEPGWSGESWFKEDKDGREWQAYVAVVGDEYMSFRPYKYALEARRLTYSEFEELFE